MTALDENDTARELAQLRAERDELRAELDATHHHATRRRWVRQTGAAILVVLACVSLVGAVVGVWARRNFLDTDRFTARVGPLIEEPSVQEALTNRLTDQVILLIDPRALFEEVLPERGQLLAVPLASAVDGFVHDRVESFVASDRFAALWAGAVEVAHRTAVNVLRGKSDVVTADDGQVTLNLIPVVNAVLAQITAASPEILGRQVDLPDVSVEDVPEAAIARIEQALDVDLGEDFGQFTVYDDGQLAAAQEGLELFDRLVLVLLPLGIVLAAVALWLSRRRRRTLLQLAAGLTIGMVLLRRVSWKLEDDIAALPPTPEGRSAVAVAVGRFLDPLTTFALWTIWAVLVVAAIAVLTADYPWVVSLRRRAGALWSRAVATTGERARDEATVEWVRGHRDPLLIAGAAVAVLVLWVTSLSWFGLLLVLGVIAAFELFVYRVGGEPPSPSGSASAP